jgi:enamine deaminase RidA (YjgF/YER057c/UK114 family)
MPKIQRIIVPDVPPPVSHYCHVTRAGPHVWVAGVVGQAQDGSIPSDVVAQFDIAIAVMDKCLKAAGAGPEHVVKVQVFMTDITERPKINPRRIAYFGDNRPASTLVEVKGLVDPRMKVEIECQAYVDQE